MFMRNFISQYPKSFLKTSIWKPYLSDKRLSSSKSTDAPIQQDEIKGESKSGENKSVCSGEPCSASSLKENDSKENICIEKPPSHACELEVCRPIKYDPSAISPPITPFEARVVIIGGGMAGLSAAHRLAQGGAKNFVILEAGTRPGGRICSNWVKDSVVEMGSERAPGQGMDKVLIETAVKDGLMEWPSSGTNIGKGLFDEDDGMEIPASVIYKSYIFVKKIMKEYNKLVGLAGPITRGSIMDYFGIRIQQELRRMPDGPSVAFAARAMMGLAITLTKHEEDCLTNDGLGTYVKMPGADVEIPLGYVGDLGLLLREIGPGRIQYKKEVSTIKWGTVETSDAPRAKVKCNDGSIYPANYVIVTCSLGVLKSLSEIMFSPSLSLNKLNAIKKLKNEHVGKVYFEFEKPMWSWREDPINLSFKKQQLKGKSGWLSGLTKVQEVAGSKSVIFALVKGKEATSKLERSSIGTIIDEMTDFIKEYFGDQEIPKPINAFKTSWTTDKHFLGAYSNIDNVGESASWQRDLMSPVPMSGDSMPPIIYFAGEATCPGLHGTVAGAKMSGIREADRLLKIMRELSMEETATTMNDKKLVGMVC